MKFNKTLLLVSLICVSQVQAMSYVKESLQGIKDKISLASFLSKFWWSRLSNNQKVASKVIVAASALYLANKLVNPLEDKEESKKDGPESSVNSQEESKRYHETFNSFESHLMNFKGPQSVSPQQVKSDEIVSTVVLEHKNNKDTKLKQLLYLFPGMGLLLNDYGYSIGMINASKITIIGNIVTLQCDSKSYSRIIMIKQKDQFSYELVSDDIIHYEQNLNEIK